MKTRIIRLAITLAMLTSIHLVNAQETFVSTYIEQTKVGQKLGTQLGYESREGYELGVFYQKEATIFGSNDDSTKPRFYEQEFAGAFFAASLIRNKRYNVKFNVRTGVTNKINFTITPSVIGNYKLNKFIKLQCGIGMRALRPTMQAGLRIALRN